MNANLIAIDTPKDWGRGKGHLGLLQDPVVFLAKIGNPYDPPANGPAAYPTIPVGASASLREELRATNERALHHWKRYQHTQRIAVNIGAAAFEPWVIAELDNPDKGLNGVTIRQLHDHVTSRHAKILQPEIDKNKKVTEEGMDTSKTLAIYIQK